MEIGSQLLVFVVEVVMVVVAILVLFAGLTWIKAKGSIGSKGRLVVRSLSDQMDQIKRQIQAQVLDKKENKHLKKQHKMTHKEKKKGLNNTILNKVYVIEFDGDMKAQSVKALSKEVSAILMVAQQQDQVVIKLTSPGGVAHGYGLAAAELRRIKDAGIHLTACVDLVAASGGYMMACVADQIVCSPFAIIGSVGVVIQLPNFNRFLKKKNIDFEQVTAGEYKRTLTIFGENTPQGREKMQQHVDSVHRQFKDFVQTNRTNLDIEKVATGEYWYGQEALDLKLVDQLMTSGHYLSELNQKADYHLYQVKFLEKKSWFKKVSHEVSQYLYSGLDV